MSLLGVVVSKALRLSNSGVTSEREAASSGTNSEIEYLVTSRPMPADDLSRSVFGVLGLPLDAIDFPRLLKLMDDAAGMKTPFLISTPNVNFLIKSQDNEEFRESMLSSDLCLADGMPLIWIAKLLGIPIHERIAGSDLFGKLKSTGGMLRRFRVFLVGGTAGAAETVCEKLNAEKCGLECVGALNPGFGTIEEMSTKQVIETINAAQPHLIAVFFGAEKAQAWLMHNHRSLQAPIRAQFGATINFEAGTVKRAPHFLRSTGFEWLWRIKEEPYLWRRYWNDGMALLWLLIANVLPLMVGINWRRGAPVDLLVSVHEGPAMTTLHLSGAAVFSNVDQAVGPFRTALSTGKPITIDVSKTTSVDPRFFGLFLMVRKRLAAQGRQISFTGMSPRIRRIFRLNRFEFLLEGEV